jgi:hypothetical protein
MMKRFFLEKIFLKVAFLLVTLVMVLMHSQAQAGTQIVFNSKMIKNLHYAGFIDEVKPTVSQLNGTIMIRGWAQDVKQGKASTTILLVSDGKQISVPFKTNLPRDDVAKSLNNKNLLNSGYSTALPAKSLGKGKHKIQVFAYQKDGFLSPLAYGNQTFIDIEVQ